MDYKRVLILHFTSGMSSREIATVTGDGKSAVSEFLKRFRECEELSYPLPEEVTNEFIGGCLYKKAGNLVNAHCKPQLFFLLCPEVPWLCKAFPICNTSSEKYYSQHTKGQCSFHWPGTP